MVQQANLKLKVCLLGDGAVGKTSLINRFVNNMFSEDYLLTIGTRTSKRTLTLHEPGYEYEVSATMLIWDIMGQMSYRKLLHPTYLKGARGAIIVCDLTRRDTLDHLGDWMDSLYVEGHVMPTVFVANKSDKSSEMKFGPREVEEVAFSYGSPCFITSAKTGENVENAFGSLGQKILSGSLQDRKPSMNERSASSWTYQPMDCDLQLPK